jgi:hypothetical protein
MGTCGEPGRFARQSRQSAWVDPNASFRAVFASEAARSRRSCTIKMKLAGCADSSHSVDVAEILPELKRLFEEARKDANAPDHFNRLHDVAMAIREGETGNTSGLMQNLSKATGWLLYLAKSIATDVAASAIKQAAGLS